MAIFTLKSDLSQLICRQLIVVILHGRLYNSVSSKKNGEGLTSTDTGFAILLNSYDGICQNQDDTFQIIP